MKKKKVYRIEASFIIKYIAMKRLELLISKEFDPKSNAVTISPHYFSKDYSLFIFGLEPKALI